MKSTAGSIHIPGLAGRSNTISNLALACTNIYPLVKEAAIVSISLSDTSVMAGIQSHTFICELVNIGSDCFIGHGVIFTNDKFKNQGPARGDKRFYKGTTIGNSVSIGSNSTLLPVNICDGAIIGAGSIVTKNIDQPGVYAGNPARKI